MPLAAQQHQLEQRELRRSPGRPPGRHADGPNERGDVKLLARAVSLLERGRIRRRSRERSMLVEDAAFLERALLPLIPARMGPLSISVDYRPAGGPAAGGDFYDVFPLGTGRVGAILGDVSGHGRAALERATLMHYTLRAYLETGLSPRSVLDLADRVRASGSEGHFATAVIAVYDAAEGILTYACAGHPPPIVVGPLAHEPLAGCASPPIGLGMPTVLRQSTVALPPGSTVCLYTDGVADARAHGSLLGRKRLTGLVRSCGSEESASVLLDRVARAAGGERDDMTACLIRPLEGAKAGTLRSEELELAGGPVMPAQHFLLACGVNGAEAEGVTRSAHAAVRVGGGAILRVSWTDDGRTTEILPPAAVPRPLLRREPLAG